jgi:hypothetical protein
LLDKLKWQEALLAPDFRSQTLTQLQKDLDRAQCGLLISSDHFIQELAQLLGSLSGEKLAQLLYLIDLPEKNSQLITSNDFFLDLAEQIIHREALKVFLRNKFSGK